MADANEIELKYMRKIFNAIPLPVFVVDNDVRVLLPNITAKKILDIPETGYQGKRGGDVIRCANSMEKGCGTGRFCEECVIRNSVTDAIANNRNVYHRKIRMKLVRPAGTVQVNLLVTVSPFEHEGERLALVLLEDVNDLIKIGSLLPICSSCKMVRNEEGQWEDVDKYVEERIDVNFSHAFCPVCAKRLYGKQLGESGDN